ncbi:hypothetical protein [Rhodopirellula sallentina]|uniref:Uncharacterized protein n=1 Tax=Rhodopirellula sallentina SM41 TaxID=1263870 RepID=M5U1S2_9BACT|nr:hypothetical protein [Rhodopirellula sallentina]EMI55412.1 hypothetical protein RSSM_03143 [Rhodopirellula sallentina SM41]
MSRFVPTPENTSNADTAIDIESIVRRVMQELNAIAKPAVSSAAVPPQSKPSNSGPAGSQVLDCRLVTLSEINAISSSVKQITLPAGAVVTPAARDELRHRGISLTTCESNESAQSSVRSTSNAPGTRAVRLQSDGDVNDVLIASLKKQLSIRGVRLCNEAGVSVTLSSRPATTAHHACGTDRCVVSINRLDDVSRFLRELSPNVFVLDVLHLHLIALADAITTIAKPAASTQPRPKVTVSGGLS